MMERQLVCSRQIGWDNKAYQPAWSQSNRFHTSTAITDPFLAFLEGFAEHLEIVSSELDGGKAAAQGEGL